jgi:hypothetical protein
MGIAGQGHPYLDTIDEIRALAKLPKGSDSYDGDVARSRNTCRRVSEGARLGGGATDTPDARPAGPSSAPGTLGRP